MAGRMANDAELLFWRDARATWTKHLKAAQAVSWSRLHLPNFPGIARLLALEQESLRLTGTDKKHDKLRMSGRAAGKWAFALKRILKANFYKRLENGSRAQRLMFRQLKALDKWVRLLSEGASRLASLLMRLEGLTRFRIFTETRVLICTVDSTERMVRTMEEGTLEAAIAIGHELDASSCRLTLDTAIMDEAACVLEAAVPVLLALGIKNLTLVGMVHVFQGMVDVCGNITVLRWTRLQSFTIQILQEQPYHMENDVVVVWNPEIHPCTR